MSAAILHGLFLGMLLAILIGPVFFLLIHVSMKEGFRSAMLLDAGILLSDILCIVLSYFGISTLLQEESHKHYFMLAGGAALILMGIIRIWKRGRPDPEEEAEEKKAEERILTRKTHPMSLMAQGFFFNLLNPATLLFWLTTTTAAVGLYRHNTRLVFTQFAATLGTVFITDVLKAYFAKLAGRLVTPSIMRTLSLVIGLGFMVFGVVIIVRAFFEEL
ncbi:MAG: LysE family transporter [Flavobacteriales bacterium]|nr:LysE family transporter [Flavobacteriales bacterium]